MNLLSNLELIKNEIKGTVNKTDKASNTDVNKINIQCKNIPNLESSLSSFRIIRYIDNVLLKFFIKYFLQSLI